MASTFADRLRSAEAELSARDPRIALLVAAHGPCGWRPDLEGGPLFPVLASTILYQQLSGKAAATIERRFVALFPGSAYPEAHDVLAAEEDTLRGAGVSRPKIAALRDLARHQVSGALPSIEELDRLDDEAVIASLTHVRGIGRWTVEMLLMFRLGRLDVWAVDDLGLRKGAQALLDAAEPLGKKAMVELGESWRPYRSVTAWHLWRIVDGA